jgi:NDP-sugar pyrophosphorylase family protein
LPLDWAQDLNHGLISHPKALALVNGKTLLQRAIEYLQQYGIKDVVVNVHHFADQVEEAIIKNKDGEVISLSAMNVLKYWKPAEE